MKKQLIYGLLCVMALVLGSCSSLNQVARIEQNASSIYYSQLSNYFVRNDVPCKKLQKLIFDNQQDFESYFGMAASMGNIPTEVNWKTQYVVAVILPETNRATSVTPVDVCQGGNSVIMYYHVDKGDRRSYTMVPFTAVALDKPASGQGMEFYFIEK